MLNPRSKIPKFAVVSIVCQPHFGADKQDLPVVGDDAAVINYVLVHYGPFRWNIEQDAVEET